MVVSIFEWRVAAPLPARYRILNLRFAGLRSGPARPSARTSKVYLPFFRCLYFFGEVQLLNAFALWCLRLSWHWKPFDFPVALNLNFALRFFLLIFDFVSCVFGGYALKLAETDLLAFIVSEQDPSPEQEPPQPLNLEPRVGCAFRVTPVPSV